MPVIDLNGTTAIMRGGTTIDALYRGAALVWSAAPAGPLRTPIATTDTVGFEGNSQLVLIPGPEHGGQFDTTWPGTVARTFVGGGSLGGISDGEISESVWAQNGAGRNADFSAGGYLCINEGLLSTQFADGFPDPGTAQDNVTLTYVGGYLREANRIGADALVIVSNYPHRDFPDWDAPLQHAQFWRAHAMIHNPGDVWIFPLTWLIQDAVDYYGTTAVYVDPVHLNEGTYPALLLAISYAFEYFCTRALPTAYGSLTGDTLALVDRFMPIVAGYRYAGFGGTNAPADLLYLGAPLGPGNDPLPSPGLLPGETPDEEPLVDQSAIYFDETDAAEGNVSSLTTRGSLAMTFANVAGPAGSAINVMEADGLDLRGNTLRNTSAAGTYSKMTILLDVTREANPLSGAGELVNINSNGAAGVRFWLRYTSAQFQLLGPNGVTISLAPIGGNGDRQVIGGELDITAGTMTSIAADGEMQTAAITGSAIAITRIEIGKACLAKIHELAIILEA